MLLASPAAFIFASVLQQALASHPTLNGMTVFGYQGWYTGNWKWFSPAEVEAGPPTGSQRVLTDYIPYVADYPQACLEPTNFILSDGATHASWFYSNCSAVVEQHFKYMVKYKIDGIFVQRFYSAIDPSDTYYQATLQVLNWVRSYAEKYNKYFAVEYDFSQIRNTTDPNTYLPVIKNDFQKNVVPLFNSSSYIYQDNKPVVEMWGVGTDPAGANGPQFQNILGTLKNNTSPQPWVIMGVPWYWTDYSSSDALGYWKVYPKADCIQPWGVGVWTDDSSFQYYYTNRLLPGKKQTDAWGIKYSPVAEPGTSNRNAAYSGSGPKAAFGPRYNGTLYQTQLAKFSGAEMKPWFVFGAMFDEYTEGSQILPSLTVGEIPTNPNPGFTGTDANADRFLYMNISGNYTTALHKLWGQTPLSP